MSLIGKVGDCVRFPVMNGHGMPRRTQAVITDVTTVYKVRLPDGTIHTIDSKETVPGSFDLYQQEKTLRTDVINALKALEDFLSKH